MSLRILRVIPNMNPKDGGPAELVRQVTPRLEAAGHQVTIATTGRVGSAWIDESPFDVVPLGRHGQTRYGLSPRLKRWLISRAGNFDVMILDGLWQYHGHAVHAAWLATGTPYVVYPHGMLDPWFKTAFPLKHARKCLHYLWSERRLLRDAQAVLFTDSEERLRARASFHPYRCRERVSCIGTAAPPDRPAEQRQAFLERYPQLADRHLFLYLGRIHPKKAPELVVEGFASQAAADPASHLVMAGPGEAALIERLQGLASRLGLVDRITWTGMIQGDLKWGALRCAGAFVLASHHENFGIAVAEAMACGVPVLISRKIHIWREVVAEGAGLTAADTLAGVHELFRRWRGCSPDERRQMSTAARRAFDERFEITAATGRLVEVLEEVARPMGGRR